jgi:glycosyltransferase involved in cell wall biosynthesis
LSADVYSASIVIACRNERRHIAALLDSIYAQQAPSVEFEVIVADGMSDDGTREILDAYRRSYPTLRVVDNPKRFVSNGLNLAIAQASGEFILRMDAHTEYAPDYVEQCLVTLLATGADNAGGPARTKAHGLVGRAVAAAYHSRFSTGGARFHDDNYEGPADTVPYGCWRKETLLRLGLLDESLVRNQDDELNLRITRTGGRIWQSPRIKSWYHPRSSLSALWRQYFQYGFWKVRVIQKHHLPASWRHLVPGLFVVFNLISAVASLLLLAAGRTGEASFLLLVWSAAMALYATACAGIGFITAKRAGWDLLPLLPVVFATYHLSYGSGFVLGLLHWSRSGGSDLQASRAFSGLSR